MRIAEAASELGLSVKYLRKLVARNQISYSRPTGKIIYFTKKDIENYFQRGRVEAI